MRFCNSIKRVYIHEDIYDDLRDELVDFARGIKVGNGADAETDLGPIQNLPQYEKVIEYIEDCKAMVEPKFWWTAGFGKELIF